jgi:hypothetical protein
MAKVGVTVKRVEQGNRRVTTRNRSRSGQEDRQSRSIAESERKKRETKDWVRAQGYIYLLVQYRRGTTPPISVILARPNLDSDGGSIGRAGCSMRV